MGLCQHTCKYKVFHLQLVQFYISNKPLINKIFQIAEIVPVGTFTNILYCKGENQMQRKQFILVNDLMYYYLYQIYKPGKLSLYCIARSSMHEL